MEAERAAERDVGRLVARAGRETIGDAFGRAVARNPRREALVFGERRWSYAELDAGANRVARTLHALGLVKGDRLAAYGKNSDAYVLLWLGCLRAGVIHVPVNFSLKGAELLYILGQSGAKAVFHDAAFEGDVLEVFEESKATLRGTLRGEEDDVLAVATGDGEASEPKVELSEGDVAQICYTSGTTSAPKGAMMSHRAYVAEYASCIYALEYTEEDRVLHSLPLYHTAQMHVFLMPYLLVGATNYLVEAPVPEECFRIVAEERIDSMFAPPTVWISFLRHPGFEAHDLTSLEKIQYGASIMPVPVLRELRERLPGVRLYNCYGQTETAPLATVLLPEEHTEERLASAGRPVLNVRSRVVDGEMRDLPAGENGEIVHRSPHLLSGYWEKPEETAEAFRGGWFHSGDLGYLDKEGYLYVVDRVKDVINTGGVQVSGREVEEALYSHEAVSEVAVIGLPDEKWIEAVTAVVALKSGSEATDALADELKALARERLAPYKVPKHVHFVEDLPKNGAGKLLKRELRDRFSGKTAPT